MSKRINIHSIANPTGKEALLENGTYQLHGVTHYYRKGENAITKPSMQRQGSIFVKRDKLGMQRAQSKRAHTYMLGSNIRHRQVTLSINEGTK